MLIARSSSLRLLVDFGIPRGSLHLVTVTVVYVDL